MSATGLGVLNFVTAFLSWKGARAMIKRRRRFKQIEIP